MTGNDLSTDDLVNAVDRAFRSHEDIMYIAILDDELKVIVQRGFIDLHPSKLHMLHVQASMLVDMSNTWPDALGTLDHTTASFNKSEIMVMPLAHKLHLVAVFSPNQKKDSFGIRSDILKQFNPAKRKPVTYERLKP